MTMAPQPTPQCPHCGNYLVWNRINQQYYCNRCELFIQSNMPMSSFDNLQSELDEAAHPQYRPQTYVCPFCGTPINYIQSYQRWYCYRCGRWV